MTGYLQAVNNKRTNRIAIRSARIGDQALSASQHTEATARHT